MDTGAPTVAISIAAVARAMDGRPHIATVGVGGGASRDELLQLMQAGVRDVIPQFSYREILHAAFYDFAELDIREHDSVISEGTAHVGMSALIDLVGRK